VMPWGGVRSASFRAPLSLKSRPENHTAKNVGARREGACGIRVGLYLRLIDSCITQLKAQGPSRTCNESKEEAEDPLGPAYHLAT